MGEAVLKAKVAEAEARVAVMAAVTLEADYQRGRSSTRTSTPSYRCNTS